MTPPLHRFSGGATPTDRHEKGTRMKTQRIQDNTPMDGAGTMTAIMSDPNPPDSIKDCADYTRTKSTDGAVPQCWADDRPCEVLAAVAARAPMFDLATVDRDFHRHLPCDRCRGAERAARRLPGTRIGGHGRALLLAAHATDDDGVAVAPAGTSHSGAVVLNRAARRLADSGLVALWQGVEERPRIVTDLDYDADENAWFRLRWQTTAGHAVNCIALTLFGAALVARYHDELETGAVIRWDDRVQAALVSVRETTGALLARFCEAVADDFRVTMFTINMRRMSGSTADDSADYEYMIRAGELFVAISDGAND
jgi:hypothetical protein